MKRLGVCMDSHVHTYTHTRPTHLAPHSHVFVRENEKEEKRCLHQGLSVRIDSSFILSSWELGTPRVSLSGEGTNTVPQARTRELHPQWEGRASSTHHNVVKPHNLPSEGFRAQRPHGA